MQVKIFGFFNSVYTMQLRTSPILKNIVYPSFRIYHCFSPLNYLIAFFFLSYNFLVWYSIEAVHGIYFFLYVFAPLFDYNSCMAVHLMYDHTVQTGLYAVVVQTCR